MFEKCKIDFVQIRILLWKDFLVRIRQPWMTFVQYLWPCMIFLALLVLRNRFQPLEVDECQFPTRQLPTKHQLLPFFQSYICTIENRCQTVKEYEEIPHYENTVVSPFLGIIQIFLSEEDLYKSITTTLAEEKNILSSVLTIGRHSRLKELEGFIVKIIKRVPDIEKIIGQTFNINKIFSDGQIFSKVGDILCGKPFPHSNMIRFVENIFYTPDYNGPDVDELEAMPTPYCKQLYLDVTRSNHGKITWKHLKPIIQGKIVYGPESDRNREIMEYSNTTFFEFSRLRTFAKAIETTIKLYKNDADFKGKITNLLDLAKSSIGRALIGDSVDIDQIESIMNSMLEDPNTENVISVISNLLECFSVDRYVPVNSQKEFEEVALKLNEKKLYYAGVYFNDTLNQNSNEISYSIRMDPDNTPVTIENRNKFWFPGAEGSFELDMRYHRGFAQIQQAVDNAIIRYQIQRRRIENGLDVEVEVQTERDEFDFNDDDDLDEEVTENTTNETSTVTDNVSTSSTTSTTTPKTITTTRSSSQEIITNTTVSTSNSTEETTTEPNILELIKSTFNLTDPELEFSNGTDVVSLDEFIKNANVDEDENGNGEVKNRTRRQADAGGFFGLLGASNEVKKVEHMSDTVKLYTKQFPYPKYIRDDYKRGMYLSQSIQIAFFFALIVQVASSVRQRIWMKESGNSLIMRAMGLKKSSETISWVVTTLFELIIIFILMTIVLYCGGIILFTTKSLMYLFLIVFGLCLISFCYLISNFFNQASIGSVTAVILFLTAFLPYIVIVSLGATLGSMGKFIANLSFSTAFCYAWHFVLRLELQHKEANLESAFAGPIAQNDFKFGFLMMILDLIIYAVIGYLVERYKSDDLKFHQMNRRDLDTQTGAVLQNVTKIYGTGKPPAVNNLSMVIRKDFVTTILGRNGAGKSTIIKMLTGQTLPTHGEIFLPQTYDLISGNNKQEQLGLCPQNNVLIPNLTAKEHLKLYARLKMRNGFSAEVARVLDLLNLGKYENYRSKELSGGFKRRLCIANAFMGSPNLVILDEPCSSVDTKARKNIWELIESLRKGRAVILATHYLDEAEHLSDNVLMLNKGNVVAENTPDILKDQFTNKFTLRVEMNPQKDVKQTIDDIKKILSENVQNYEFLEHTKYEMAVNIPYRDEERIRIDFSPVILSLEDLKSRDLITNFKVTSKNLHDLFNKLNELPIVSGTPGTETKEKADVVDSKFPEIEIAAPIQTNLIRNLFWKRFLHFKRNYRILICTLVLPTIFEIIAMGFMTLRPPGEHDNNLILSKDLYAGSKEFFGYEWSDAPDNNSSMFMRDTYDDLTRDCGGKCALFNNSETSFYWLLNTTDEYVLRRYGGITINSTKGMVWYNNKGYHSMPTYMNVLNTALLRAEMHDQSFNIRTTNHPIILGARELSTSSVLQSVADAGIALILLVAFSLVIAAASVFIVSERVSGEKLQQKLCGIDFKTYWGVAFVWDFIIYLIALGLCVIVFLCFNIPIYVAKDNLAGIVVLFILYGFASIPCVHLVEKIFSESSFANMSIFCLNVIIALTTLTVILMFDILGETDETEKIRNILNRVFLIFPQHALADAMIELCKNHIQAEIFLRYYINTYKSPISSDLLHPHFLALIIQGVIFMVLNFIIESGYLREFINKHFRKTKTTHELRIISIQNSLKRNEKLDQYTQECILKVENLSKSYNKTRQKAVDNVSFEVMNGECYGLLGTNGAGKSTIFSILSGQMDRCSGNIEFYDNNGISYCPQNNPTDVYLTVEEVMKFYVHLKCIQNVDKVIQGLLEFYHLEIYRDVLVKNLSGGNRRKLTVAVTCIGRTKLILMDEPTSDMDPVTRSLVYKSINVLLNDQRSIILTSHTISEIENICTRIGILRDGKLISSGTPVELKSMFGNCYAVTLFYDKIESLTIQREIEEEFPTAQNILTHNHSMQFIIKITHSNQLKDNHTMLLSDLFVKLHTFSTERNILYTISECLLDQAFESILESDESSYYNTGFVQTETSTTRSRSTASTSST